jgi:hypothetical protein
MHDDDSMHACMLLECVENAIENRSSLKKTSLTIYVESE